VCIIAILPGAPVRGSPTAANPVADFIGSVRAAKDAFERQDYAHAARLYEGIVQANPVNPFFLQQLADSEYLAGDYTGSISAYRKMLELGADQPSYCAYYLARAYAKAGDSASAMHWLTQAMQWGYPKLEDARTDEALAALHAQPGFADLLGITDTTNMTRTQGWRLDLAFLSRWIKARSYHPFRTDTGDRFVSRALYTEAEFDAKVEDLERSIPKLTDAQIEAAMMRLIASLGDGHTEWAGFVRPKSGLTLPLKFELFQEGLFITATAPGYRNLLGAKVLAFDNHPVPQVMTTATPYLSRDNDYWIDAFMPQLLRYPGLLNGMGIAHRMDQMNLSLKGMDGRTGDFTVPVTTDAPYIWNELPSPPGWINLPDVLSKPIPLYLQKNSETYWFDYQADNKLVYFQFNRVLDGAESLAQFTERLGKFLDTHAVDRLVIDMRWNNGGNTYLSQPLLQLLMGRQSINRTGHLFVIIGPRTFSAALNTAEAFERYLNAVFIGEPTGGRPNSPGEEWFFSLPYSKANVSLSNLYWESGWPVDSRWAIPPEIYTPRTFADYLAGRDPAMDAALAYPSAGEEARKADQIAH
jgi:tetratricopeptide (TPR) repeat protein